MSDDPTLEAVRAEPAPPVIPGRLRRALLLTVPNAAPADLQTALARELNSRRDRLGRWGTDDATFGWFADLDAIAPESAPAVRQLVTAHVAGAAIACAVPDFDLQQIEAHALLLHHGCAVPWSDGTDRVAIRLGWELTLHAEPRMFSGGELESADGTTVAPDTGRLTFWHPAQQVRRRAVECWSAHVLHGRWSVGGVVLGTAPDGWADVLRRLRG